MAKQLMKRALKSNFYPYLALLDFHNTPTQGMGTSPEQRLMSRRTKTLPTKESLLLPKVLEARKEAYERQAYYYNRSAKDLEPLKIQDRVRISPPDWMSKEWKKGVVSNVYPIALM